MAYQWLLDAVSIVGSSHMALLAAQPVSKWFALWHCWQKSTVENPGWDSHVAYIALTFGQTLPQTSKLADLLCYMICLVCAPSGLLKGQLLHCPLWTVGSWCSSTSSRSALRLSEALRATWPFLWHCSTFGAKCRRFVFFLGRSLGNKPGLIYATLWCGDFDVDQKECVLQHVQLLSLDYAEKCMVFHLCWYPQHPQRNLTDCDIMTLCLESTINAWSTQTKSHSDTWQFRILRVWNPWFHLVKQSFM